MKDRAVSFKREGGKRRGRALWLAAACLVFAAAGCPIGLIEFDDPKIINFGEPANLTGYLPSPAAGAAPVLSFAAEKFTGGAEWTDDRGAAVSGLFQAGKRYTAAVTLRAPRRAAPSRRSCASTTPGALPTRLPPPGPGAR